MSEHVTEAVLERRPLESLMAERVHGPHEWEEPIMFDLSNEDDRARLEGIYATDEKIETVDNIDRIANDLFEVRHPLTR